MSDRDAAPRKVTPRPVRRVSKWTVSCFPLTSPGEEKAGGADTTQPRGLIFSDGRPSDRG